MVGRIDLDYQVILTPAAPNQRIVAYGLRASGKLRENLATLGST